MLRAPDHGARADRARKGLSPPPGPARDRAGISVGRLPLEDLDPLDHRGREGRRIVAGEIEKSHFLDARHLKLAREGAQRSKAAAPAREAAPEHHSDRLAARLGIRAVIVEPRPYERFATALIA